jgi:ribosome-associated toxin RatA of RatAB toxin-antitoxin module
MGIRMPMPSYSSCRSACIEATPQECFDALTDFESLPSWQGAVRSARVLERDDRGRASVVEYEVDARVAKVTYRLAQIYDEPRKLGSRYLGGDFKDFEGEWRFTPTDDGRTRAELDLSLDPGRRIPRPLRSLISEAVVRRALSDLEKHMKSTPKGA